MADDVTQIAQSISEEGIEEAIQEIRKLSLTQEIGVPELLSATDNFLKADAALEKAQEGLNQLLSLKGHLKRLISNLEKSARKTGESITEDPQYLQYQEQLIETRTIIQDSKIDLKILENYWAARLPYEQILNKFVGQKINFLFVYENKEGKTELLEVNDLKLEDLSFDQETGTIGFKKSIMKHGIKTTDKDIRSQFQNLPIVFDSVINKAKRSRAFFKQYSQKNIASILILYKPHGRWQRFWVANFGPLNETYASYIKHKQDLRTIGEIGVEEFLEEGVVNVTNLPGLYEGDIRISAMEQYAVKMFNAGLDGIVLAREQALRIKKQGDNLSKEFVENLAKELRERYNVPLGRKLTQKGVSEIESLNNIVIQNKLSNRAITQGILSYKFDIKEKK